MALLAATVVVGAPILALAEGTPAPLVLMGGGQDNPAVLAEALSLAGGSRARVGIVAAGSSNPAAAGSAYARAFEAFGVPAEYVPIADRDAAMAPETIRKLAAADLLFFTGGDQRRFAERIGATLLQGAILDAWRRGAVVAGTSAGAMPWGAAYISNGTSLGAFLEGFGKDLQGQPGLELRPGLRLVDELIVDTHFDAKQRLGRLLLALAASPAGHALGVDEETGAILDRGMVKAMGRGTVTILQAKHLMGNNAAKANQRNPFAAGPFTMSRLIDGQTYSLGQGAVPRPSPEPSATPAPGFFFGLFGTNPNVTPAPARASSQPVTLVAAAVPPPALSSLAAYVRDAGGTQARIVILAGNGASRDADLWRGHLLLLGAGRASVITASELHDRNLAQAIERASALFFLEDATGTMLDALSANRRQLRDVLANYATRLPMGAASLGVRILGEVAYFGHPGEPGHVAKLGLRLLPGAVAEDQLWEAGGLERLIQATLMGDRALGIGLAPDNSVRLENGQAAVIGKGQCVFIDAKNVGPFTLPASESAPWASAMGLEVSVVPPEGAYDLPGHRPRF